MDAIVVSRVSDVAQVDGYSLDAQERHGRECAQNKKLVLIHEFSFQETASKAFERKKFQEVLCFIAKYSEKNKNKPLHVIAEKPDRLTRNHSDKETLQTLCKNRKIVLHYYKDGRVCDHTCSPTAIFMDDVVTSMSRYAAANIGSEAKKGMLEKCRQGWLPGKAPWGYINITSVITGKEEKIVVPDERAVPMVKRIFQLRAEQNLSYDAIYEQIKAENLFPLIKKKSGKFKTFHKSSIEKILKDTFYGGTFLNGADGPFTGKHELFVPREVYEKARASLFGKTVGTRHNHKNLFGGWISCGRDNCDCKISFHVHTKPSGLVFEHYVCANGRRVHSSLRGMYMTEAQIFSQFEAAFDRISISSELADEIRRSLIQNHQVTLDKRQAEADSYDQAMKLLEREEDEVYSDLKKGLLDDEGYKRQLHRIRGERAHYSGLLHKSQKDELEVYLKKVNIVLELAQDAKLLWNSRSSVEKRDFLKKLLWNPKLNPPSIEFQMKPAFKLLANMNQNENWGD